MLSFNISEQISKVSFVGMVPSTVANDFENSGFPGQLTSLRAHTNYSVIQKEGLNFVRLYFLNCM